ncbi:hypothetical protein Rsub_09451 [Raphidocelis subcapitata]|uniref:Uncharacterized protein n=1 Tax=Raphidocelis subcapitata TaxID=307507 RepID=A0A2V0PB07_9CHLO|nr:hypothetical protein Rsub_09451 [Raphidocelis subcapitata]|eukprot:GBF96709.1 hypothetical protein Rsub_09451 [Raphidocelis subcapitata]
MLKVLHNHIFASKLRDVFASSPLVLVYQTVGTVDVSEAAAKLQSQLDAALPAARLRVRMCRMRNSVAAGAGDAALARLFQASNLIVGFGPEAAAAAAADADAAAAEARAGRRDGLAEVLGGLFGASAAQQQEQQQQQPRGFEHRTLAKAFNLGAALPGQQPLVLLGAFYGRESIRLAHLKEWVGLDETRVYSELLGALESPMQALLALDGPAADLASTLDAAAPHDVLAALDARAAAAGGEGGGGAAATAGA